MKRKDKDYTYLRGILGAIVLLYFLIIIQLFRWQVKLHDYFKKLGDIYVQATRKIPQRRGTIYTADGIVVATDRIYWRPIISVVYDTDYKHITKNWNKLKKIFAPYQIELPESPPPPTKLTYYPLKPLLEDSQKTKLAKKLKENKIKGVFFEEEIKRLYPLSEHLAHVLGFVAKKGNNSYAGVYGIEGYFWPEINGKTGLIKHQRDIQGGLLTVDDYQQLIMREGKNIVLTINSKIQRKVEQILKKKVEEYKAVSGTVIILNPKDGAIIAMANYPTYDPNNYFLTNDYWIFKNKAVSDPYEYGSVQKPLTIAIALENNVISQDFKCYDEGRLKVLDKDIYNYGHHKYGWLDLEGILYRSDNVCTAKIALKLTPQIMVNYLHKLGIGRMINLGLQEEESSFLKPPNKWNEVDLAVSGFGQMISATPLQIISAMSAIANNGIRMQPYIIKKIYDNDETIEFKPHPAEYVFSAETSRFVKTIMMQSTMRRKAFRKYSGITIAGKTGTAQIPNPEGPGYLKDEVNTTFVGFAPADNPKVIMLVKFERPHSKPATGSATAAPTWLEIFEAIKGDLEIY